MTTYTYSISGDFPNAEVDLNRLTQEIQASAIVTALDHLGTEGDDCLVIFKADLSPGDETVLDGLVAAHSGEPLPDTGYRDDGVQYVAPVPGRTSAGMTVRGIRFEAELGTDTNYDVAFAELRDLSGASGEAINHSPGDYIDFLVVHPITGVIAQFGEMLYVPPSGKFEPFVSERATSIPAGLIVRTRYHSVATTGSKPILCGYLRTYK